jgi:esterase
MSGLQNYPQEKFMVINDLNLHYLCWGNESNRKVLLLHGFAGCAASWNPLASALAGYRHVLALDQRGHGDSQWADLEGYAIEDFVSDVSGFIEALGIQEVTLIGHSMGGNVALAYTASHPEKVDRLVIVDIGPEVSKAGARRLREQILTKEDVYASLEEVVNYLRLYDPFAQREVLYREAEYLTKKIDNNRFTWKYDRRLNERFGKPRSGKTVDWWKVVSAITCPTLILRGKESDVLDSRIAAEMKEAMLQAELVEINGAGHYVHRDNPQRFKEAVFRFLGLGNKRE